MMMLPHWLVKDRKEKYERMHLRTKYENSMKRHTERMKKRTNQKRHSEGIKRFVTWQKRNTVKMKMKHRKRGGSMETLSVKCVTS